MQSAETLRDSTRRGTSPFRRRFLRARRTWSTLARRIRSHFWFVAGWLLRGDGVHIASALARSVSDRLHVTDSAGLPEEVSIRTVICRDADLSPSEGKFINTAALLASNHRLFVLDDSVSRRAIAPIPLRPVYSELSGRRPQAALGNISGVQGRWKRKDRVTVRPTALTILPLHFMFRIGRYGWKPFCASSAA